MWGGNEEMLYWDGERDREWFGEGMGFEGKGGLGSGVGEFV